MGRTDCSKPRTNYTSMPTIVAVIATAVVALVLLAILVEVIRVKSALQWKRRRLVG